MRAIPIFCLLVCSFTCVLVPEGVARAEEPATTNGSTGAAELYKRATDLYRDHKLPEALKAYRDAWALQQSYDIATNLGAVELDLQKYRDAAEHLSFALRSFPARGKPEERATIEKRLAMAKAEVVTVRVTVNIDKADVALNGKRAGLAPIAEELFADPGTVSVEATLAGYETGKESFEGTKGMSRDVEIKLVPKRAEEPSRLPIYIAFGVGGAGLVVGAVTGGLAMANNDDLSKKCKANGACPESARAELSQTNAFTTTSTIGFVAAALGAGVGVTLLLLSRKPATPTPTAIVLGPSFVGVKGVF